MKRNLTKRELDCYLWLLKGRSVKEIAQKLNLSARTVDFYVTSMKLKLNCARKSELFDRAMEFGLLTYADRDSWTPRSSRGMKLSLGRRT